MRASRILLSFLVFSGAAELLVFAADAGARSTQHRGRARFSHQSEALAGGKSATAADVGPSGTTRASSTAGDVAAVGGARETSAATDVSANDVLDESVATAGETNAGETSSAEDVHIDDVKKEAATAADVRKQNLKIDSGGTEEETTSHRVFPDVKSSRGRYASSARQPPHATRGSSTATTPRRRAPVARRPSSEPAQPLPTTTSPARRRGTATYKTSAVRTPARSAARWSPRRGSTGPARLPQRTRLPATSAITQGRASTGGQARKVVRRPARVKSRRRGVGAGAQTTRGVRVQTAAKPSPEGVASGLEQSLNVVREPATTDESSQTDGSPEAEEAPKSARPPAAVKPSRRRGGPDGEEAPTTAGVPTVAKPPRRHGASDDEKTPRTVNASPAAKVSQTRVAPAAEETLKPDQPPAAPHSRRRGTPADSQRASAARASSASSRSSRRPAQQSLEAAQRPPPSQKAGVAAAVATRTPYRAGSQPRNKARVGRPVSVTSAASKPGQRRRRKKGRTSSSSAQIAVSKAAHSAPTAAAAAASRPPVPSLPVGKDKRKIVCYYTNWSQYRPAMGKYMPKDIDPFLCTHIVFAFSSMSGNRLSPFEQNDLVSSDGQPGLYAQVTGLKKVNPRLKVLLAVGGWSFGTKKFKDMSGNRYNRRTFVYSVASYLRAKNFDGLDLDWEYPKGGTDKSNFVKLCKDLREAFEEESLDTGKERLLLTAAVPVGPDAVRSGYDVAKLARHLDLFHIMAYDFHGKWESQVGHHAPLNAPLADSAYRRRLSVNASVHMWMDRGAPKHKIVLGMPTYGRSFTLARPGNTKVNAPARGGGVPGQYTGEEGFLAYYEICQRLHGGATYVWDDEMSVPYMIDGDQWVGFDDERAVRLKMDFIKEMDLAGAMVWAVDMDDFAAAGCGGAAYPLMSAMREELLEVPRTDRTPDIDWSRIAKRQVAPQSPPETTAPALSQISIADILAVLKAQGITPDLSAIQNLQAKASRGLSPTSRSSAAAVEQPLDENLAPPKMFCYVTSWARDRPGQGRFTPSDLPPDLCTHVVWAFGGVADGRLQLPSDDQKLRDPDSDYQQLLQLREANAHLRILLSIGGQAVEPETFQQLTSSSYKMNNFVYGAVDTIRKLKLDGLDIDWEYPSGPEDRDAVSRLVAEFRQAFDSEAAASRKARLLLTVALPGTPTDFRDGYDIKEISKHADFLNVMLFDFHGAWEDVVGHNAPLYSLQGASPQQQSLSMDGAVRALVEAGAAPEKTLVGLATYGRSFTLADPEQYDIGASVEDAGKAARFTQEPGFAAYFEVCEFLDRENTTLIWDNEQEVPFAVNGNQWVGFDDGRSLEKKVAWLRQLGIGGVLIWAADLDDFGGTCGDGSYPLITTVRRALDGYRVPYTYDGVTAAPGTGGRVSTGAGQVLGQAAAADLVCSNEDNAVTFHRDPLDCKHYYLCQGTVQHHMPCPSDLVFNEAESVCDWPENVELCWAFTQAPV